MALTDIRECLVGIAEQLGAQLCGKNFEMWSQTQDTISKGTHTLLLLSEPADLQMYEAGDVMKLICFAENTPATFWRFVAETNDDEDLESKARRWSSYEAEEFENYPYTTLNNGTTVHLSFCRRPAQLDPNDVQSATFPIPSGYGISPRLINRHKDIKDALKAHEMITAHGAATYDVYAKITAWAKNARLIAKLWPTLTCTDLLWMLLSLPYESRTLQGFSQYFRTPDHIEAVRTYTDRKLSPNVAKHANRIARQFQRLHNDESKWSVPSEQHFDQFCGDEDVYILIATDCYDTRVTDRYQKQLQATADAVIARLQDDLQLESRIWPDFCYRHATEYEPTHLLLGAKSKAQSSSGPIHRDIRDVLLGFPDISNAEFMIRVLPRLLRPSETANLQLDPLTVSARARPDDTQPPLLANSNGNGQRPERFRSVRQVLARLQHDPKHRSTSYQVGYVDRFEGLKWKPIEEFSRPTEDEEFIPEHRVQQVRRTHDKVTTWDRATRKDETNLKA